MLPFEPEQLINALILPYIPANLKTVLSFSCTLAGVFSVLAVILGQLPGDWGFFSSYLTGGVVLGVLAVGSTAPGLLQGIIDKFSQLWPDYRERVVGHEAAHLLIGECGPAAAGLNSRGQVQGEKS